MIFSKRTAGDNSKRMTRLMKYFSHTAIVQKQQRGRFFAPLFKTFWPSKTGDEIFNSYQKFQ